MPRMSVCWGPFSACPSSPLTRIDSVLFWVVGGCRQQAFGSGLRRLAVAWRSAVGCGHHIGVPCSWQWRTKTRSCNHGRCGLDSSQEAQREDLRGVDRPRGECSFGGSRSGRWSAETKSSMGQLAEALARSEPRVHQHRMEQAWKLKWCSILSCAAACSFAMSLVGLKGTIGADGHAQMPHEMECDHSFAGLD